MKCLFYFREKSKGSKSAQSAPELERRRNSGDKSPVERGSKSSSSIANSSTPSTSRSLPDLFEEKAHNLRVFTLTELRNATNDFSPLLKIGSGGFGTVYKGFVKSADGNGNRIVVAIKKLNKDSLQGHKQWKAEVQFLAVVDHPNLVKLIGYCSEDGERGIQRLLAYEFMPNKSLDDHLFSRTLPAIPWISRLQIVLGAAQGLTYLHEGLEVQVIYRDFKASNVLLDEEFKPKLSDFGLAREGPIGGKTHVSTSVVGTYGYAAPDYIETGRLTVKSDVWSFGVVLYEILTGRRSLDRNRPKVEQILLEWVKRYPVDSRTFCMIMDPRLGNQYSVSAARAIAKLADSCLSKNRNSRPSMNEVVESLKQAIQISQSGSPDQEMTVRKSPTHWRANEKPNQLDSIEHSKRQSPTHLGTNKKPNQLDSTEHSKRQMAHLAKLKENANAVGRRRFVIMPSASGQ